MADIRALEHSTLKVNCGTWVPGLMKSLQVPYEVLNKKFRSAQKNIDREISYVNQATNSLEQALESNNASTIGKALDAVVEKLTALKRKSEESMTEETEAAKVCKRRLDHLKEYEDLPQPAGVQWRKRRLNRMLVEYFLRAGFYNTALKLAKTSGIEDLTNIDLFLVSKNVEESLQDKDATKCLTWCHENKSKLRRLKSNLEFQLRRQEFVEMMRESKHEEALVYMRRHFTSVDDDLLSEVKRMAGLFAFPKDTKIEPYKTVYDPARWDDLIQQFRQDNFNLFQLNSDSAFSVCLQAGLSALKTPHCYKEPRLKSADCPVCSRHLNDIARSLPFAHCSQSRLICAISGQPLNEHNPPMMLPNGNVYGYNAMQAMATVNEGQVVCPRTKEIYELDEAVKVFVM